MTHQVNLPVKTLRRQLDRREITSSQLLELALTQIEAAPDQGRRVYTRVYTEAAQASAQAQDLLMNAQSPLSPAAGIPVSIKDLLDVKGEETKSASPVSNPDGPARSDALVVTRLRAAGAVIVGRTNMTAYAFSGVGRNLHHGTPGNPHDESRIPGGSSSGTAVSVGAGMATVGIGSDTGGSVRTPAALCGLVGFKPTQRRIPLQGVRPLSWSLDSIGPIATTVDCCHIFDQIMAGESPTVLAPAALDGLRIGVPDRVALDDLEPEVAAAFEQSLSMLSRRGAKIREIKLPEVSEMFELGGVSRIIVAEAYTFLRREIDEISATTESVLGERLAAGADISAADYIETIRGRAQLMESISRTLAPIDVLAMPTVPLLAPTLDSLDEPEEFLRANRLLIRNTSIGNFLDLCSISLPAKTEGSLPVGLMLSAPAMYDKRLLSIAKSVEDALS